jgi:hypothetical protein
MNQHYAIAIPATLSALILVEIVVICFSYVLKITFAFRRIANVRILVILRDYNCLYRDLPFQE